MVNVRQRVLLYGDSLLLAGLRASLKACPWCEVTALHGPADHEQLLAPGYDVVIFDLAAIESEFLLAQMQAQPGLLLVGIDPESHEVLLSGQAAGSITLDQITQFVERR